VALAVTVAIAAVVAVVVLTTRGGDSEPDAGPSVAASASCGAVVDVPAVAEPKHRDGTIEYEDGPPTSGDHNPMPLPGRRRVVDTGVENIVERAVHNLEHAYVVVWYDESVVSREDVGAALNGVTATKVIAVPWFRGGMGESRPYVLAAWGHRQDCTALTAQVVEAFYAAHGGENGDAPEKLAP
jgi:hypothetical protein